MNASKLFVPGVGRCGQCDFTLTLEKMEPLLWRCLVHGFDLRAVTWEDHANRSIEELNARLIERQESHLAQVVRIDETWREKLREKVGMVWRDPLFDPPALTGNYLVELWDGTHAMVRVEEAFMEYADGEQADPDEWAAWAEIPKRV